MVATTTEITLENFSVIEMGRKSLMNSEIGLIFFLNFCFDWIYFLCKETYVTKRIVANKKVKDHKFRQSEL